MARGDLQTIEEDIYIITTAIQIFRAMMAIAAGFNLKVWSYNMMNVYVNAKLRVPIFYKLPLRNKMEGKGLKLL